MKDLKRSLDFYTRILGFTVLEKLDFKEAKFSLVFLGQCDPKEIPQDPADRVGSFCCTHAALLACIQSVSTSFWCTLAG